jgi:membrane peptidoglycan carboxypeptidase
MSISMYNFLAVKFYEKEYNELYLKLSKKLKFQAEQKSGSYDLLLKLLISAEDHRFRYHIGFDIFAIFRAIIKNIFLKKKEGASTIEQQLVRVVTNCYEMTYSRKIQEIILSISIYSFIPKRMIPSLYLQVAYFGKNIFGIENYFKFYSINPQNLTLDQCAEIISKIKYPDSIKFNTNRNLKLKKRKAHIINLYISHSKRKYIKIYD